MKESPIQVTAEIIERKGDFNFTAKLPIGKMIMVHTPKRLDSLSRELQSGDKVILEMTTFDFDKGRIAGRA